MPRRKNRTMKGGFWNTIKGWGASASASASDMFKKKPATTPSTMPSTSPSSSPSPSPTSADAATTTTGGRRTRRKRRHRGGGYTASSSINDLAATASPFSGSKTAQPQVWIGGKSRKHRHHKTCHHKSCKRGHCKYK